MKFLSRPIIANRVLLLRNYATETTNENIRNTLKAADSRKTYLIDMYTQLWRDNSIILLAHHNNLLSTENESIRKQLKKIDAKNKTNKLEFRKLKGSIFRYFLRASQHEDPASKAAARMIKRKNLRHPLENLLKGPTAAILIRDLDPKLVKEVAKVLQSQKEKLFIMGGKVGDEIMTLQNIEEFKNMKSLPELRAELIGLLTMTSGGGVVRTLESATNALAMTLESRKNELEKAESPVEGEKQ
jgi:large subunit ribosomal protein L10